MANTENIEAKLCAYVDGELDAAERAEIEQHLQTNPQHRKLMQELTRTRDLLRALPVEPAPPDIAESLQGQLERSVLLDDSDLDRAAAAGDMRIHINRWPQFTAVAAILLLAVGLAAVVYFVLAPSRQGPEFSLAKMERHAPAAAAGEPSSAPLASADLDKDISLAKRTEGDRAKKDDTKEDTDALAEAKSSAASAKPAFKDSGERNLSDAERRMMSNAALPERGVAGVGGNTVDAREIQTQLFNAGLVANQRDAKTGVEQSPLFVVVSTQDPAATYQCVTDYLKENQIHWEQVTVPMPPPMTATQEATAMASRASERSVQLKGGGGTGGGRDVGMGSGGKIADESAKQADGPAMADSSAASNHAAAPAAAQAPPGPASAPSQTTPDIAQSIARAEANDVDRQDQQDRSREQTQSDQKSKVAGQPLQPQQQQQQLAQSQQLQSQSPQAPVAGDNGAVYVARKMTRRQAVDLKASLARAPIQQHAAVIDNAEASVSPAAKTEAPHTYALKTNEGYAKSQHDGISFAPAPAPASTPATTQAAAEAATLESSREINGTVATDAAQIGSSTQPATAPAEQSSAIASSNLPTTAASNGESAALPTPTTAAATQPIAGEIAPAATTAPAEVAAAATQPSDEPVDVVIVVQNATPGANASEATTAPNPEPATTPATAPLAQ